MKLLFVHDHQFKIVNGKYYSSGGLNDNVLERYTDFCKSLTVVARIIKEESVNNRWSEITNSKVNIKGNSGFKYNELESEINRCDKLIVRLPSFLGIQALRINKKYKKPYLIEMVGCAWDALWNHGIKGKLVAPLMLLETKKLVYKSPYVLYVTNSFLQSRYPTLGKTIGCSDVEIISSDSKLKNYRYEKINNNSKTLKIATIAAIDVKYKGQEYVIKALAELKKQGINSYEYFLIGNGSNERLKKIANNLSVLDKVHFVGGIPHEKIYEWLDTIDIYVQPSKQEGLPRAVVEAMSRGVPVIGSETGGIPELVENKYRFKASDYKKLAEILKNISINDLIYMSGKSFDTASKFCVDDLNQKRYSFYSEFINET